jgi:hypothetical protein
MSKPGEVVHRSVQDPGVQQSVTMEFRGPRPKNLKVGQEARLCEKEPFGWWDNFNDCLHLSKFDADQAAEGGNLITPLYKEIE